MSAGDAKPTRRDVATAAAVAAIASGIPSTAHALAIGADPLASSLAVGATVLSRERRRPVLVVVAAIAHVALCAGWASVLAALLPRRRGAAWGAVAGVGIAALDLGVIGRRMPRIRALPAAPQVADHVAFGAVVGFVLERRSLSRAASDH